MIRGVVVALCAAATLASCTEATPTRGADQLPLPAATSGTAEDSDEVVALSLPHSNRLAIIDPYGVVGRYLPPFDQADMNAPAGLAITEDQIAVVGTATSRLAVVDPGEGAVTDTGLFDYDHGWFVLSDVENLYAAVDEGTRGFVLIIDPESLLEAKRIEVGPGISGAALDDGRYVWTVGDEASRQFRNSSISRVNVERGSARTVLLPGQPQGVAVVSHHHAVATLRERNAVVRMSPDLSVVARRGGIPRPWGIVSMSDGRTIGVVAQGRGGSTASLRIYKASNLRPVDRIELGGRCPDAREVVVIERKAVVTCAALPGVVVVDLSQRKVVADLRMVPPEGEAFAQFEQPRNPLVVKRYMLPEGFFDDDGS